MGGLRPFPAQGDSITSSFVSIAWFVDQMQEEGHKQLGRVAAMLHLLLLLGITVLGAMTVALASSTKLDKAQWRELLR